MTLTEFLLARIAEDEARLPSRASLDSTDQRRLRAECEAKRRIVEHCEPDLLALSPGDDYVLRLLAAIYADHPDYREQWARSQDRSLRARLADAWDQGHDTLCEDIPKWCAELHPNPYRTEIGQMPTVDAPGAGVDEERIGRDSPGAGVDNYRIGMPRLELSNPEPDPSPPMMWTWAPAERRLLEAGDVVVCRDTETGEELRHTITEDEASDEQATLPEIRPGRQYEVRFERTAVGVDFSDWPHQESDEA